MEDRGIVVLFQALAIYFGILQSSRPALEPTSLLFNWHQGLFLQGESSQLAALTHLLHAAQVFKVRDAIRTLTQPS